MSTPPSFHQIGGWDLGNTIKDPLNLYLITIYTSIDSWDEYVLARSREEVDAYLAETNPQGFSPGYEPKVEQLNSGLDSIYITL